MRAVHSCQIFCSPGIIAFLFNIGLALDSAHAQPVQWPSAVGGNDHYYQFVAVTDPFTGTNNSWLTAKTNAEAMMFNSFPGYLATITSLAENNFLLGIVPTTYTSFSGAWLGGKPPAGWLVGPEAGQSFGFTNWGGIEPNNAGYAYMSINQSGGPFLPGKWADDSAGGIPWVNDPVIGYFVEFSAVPEPSSVLLMTTALAGWAAMKRRRLRKTGPDFLSRFGEISSAPLAD